MKPREKSHRVLSITRSKAKMYEFDVPEEEHINITDDPAKLLDLTIGILGDFASPLYEITGEDVNDHRKSLKFASYFFDSYINTKLSPEYDDYLLILGASSYFLCDLPGSASVLSKKLRVDNNNRTCSGFDNFIIWILNGDFSKSLNVPDNIFSRAVKRLSRLLLRFQSSGNQAFLNGFLNQLRRIAIQYGTDREILLADVSIALIRKRISMSTWVCLPQYTGIGIDRWSQLISKMDIKELWPAQRLLGEIGIYRGRSAVVQMPTSAGKTKATELILRSSFLSDRASLAVIVAPFRALCAEIHSDLQKVFFDENISIEKVSDSIQSDFSLAELIGQKSVVVVTPEKLDFMLRQDPLLSHLINLLIYDEGHLFDDGTRGVKYELLLASLKAKISAGTQVVLISAVISNAGSIKDWLLNEEGAVVTGTELSPTYRTIAFTSWQDKQLHFVSQEKPDTQVFFVPYILHQIDLKLIGKETKIRKFPIADDGGDIALFLGLKLFNQGSVAIFTGKKPSASKIVKRFLEIRDRGYDKNPSEFSDLTEIARLYALYKENFGEEYHGTVASQFGVFAHHGDVPEGIRLSIEFALQRERIKFVVCTSTLAQGVNLPLRYLIVSGTRQSKEMVKTRDFHNLIGRAGRAGMYTEGSIIFSNPEIWDSKNTRQYGRNSWDDVQNLLDFDNAEACDSLINNLFLPISDYWGRVHISFNVVEFLDVYLNNREQLNSYISTFVENNHSRFFDAQDINNQIRQRLNTFSAIESYLLANLFSNEGGTEQIEGLAKMTLSFSQLSEDDKPVLIEIFQKIAKKILEVEPNPQRRIIYSRTFQGINNNIQLNSWVTQRVTEINDIKDNSSFISVFMPVFLEFISRKLIQDISPDLIEKSLKDWMDGKPYFTIYNYLKAEKVGGKFMTMEHTVSLCDSCFSFDGSMLVGAVAQLLELDRFEENEEIINKLKSYQKSMKYGLPNDNSIAFFELGFSDRQIAQLMAVLYAPKGKPTKSRCMAQLKEYRAPIVDLLKSYPGYFTERMSVLLK